MKYVIIIAVIIFIIVSIFVVRDVMKELKGHSLEVSGASIGIYGILPNANIQYQVKKDA